MKGAAGGGKTDASFTRTPGSTSAGTSPLEDLLRTKGRTQGLVDVPSLDLLESMTARLASEWKKQLLFLSKMRKLYLECVDAGDDGEDKWNEEHKRLHESTWPPTREIQGIPPADSEALKPWRTVLPEPAYKEWLEAILGRGYSPTTPRGKGFRATLQLGCRCT